MMKICNAIPYLIYCKWLISLPQRGDVRDTFPYRLHSTLLMHINAFFIWLQVLARCLFHRPPSASVSHSEHVARFCQRVSLLARASARPHEQAGAFDVIERHSARARASHSCPRVLNQSFTWMTVQLPLWHPETSSERFQSWIWVNGGCERLIDK